MVAGRAAILGLGLLVAPTPASAARVEILDGALYVAAPKAERNVLDITPVGLEWEVEESRASLTAGPGCALTAPGVARCRGAVMRVSVAAGPRDDLVGVWGARVPVRITGGSGRDLLESGSGDDELDGGSGADSLWSGGGADVLDGGGDGDYLQGQDGDDRLRSGAGDDLLFGGDGRDELGGGTERDLLDGGAGRDRVDGEAGADGVIEDGRDDVRAENQDAVYAPRAVRKCRTCAPAKPRATRPDRWPPRDAADARASRGFARTRAELRTRRRPRGVTVFVDTIGSYRSVVRLTFWDRDGRRVGRPRRHVVDTDHQRTFRTPRPPARAVRVTGRCLCER